MALNDEIVAYESMRGALEADYMGKWVLFHGNALICTYDSFDDAATDAVQRYGRGPYLIRQVGAPAVVLPAYLQSRPCRPSSAGLIP
jgi:hypothetical protein